MSTEFEYNGATPGSTPANDADLHDNGGNPFAAAGSPAIDLADTTEFPLAAPIGYFTNPLPKPDNPHALGSGGEARPAGENELARYIGGGLDAAYAEAMNYQEGSSLGGASQASGGPPAVYNDEGYDTSGTSRS